MKKYSVVIEFDDETCPLTAQQIEIRLAQQLRRFCDVYGLSVAHLEASYGSLLDAFNVGLEAK